MLNSINLLVYSIILLPLLTILPMSVSLSNTTLNVMAGSNSDSDKIRAIDFPKFSSSLSWNDINDFAYQLQDINLTAIGGTKFDIVIMDYSKDGSDSGKFGVEEIDELQNSASGSKRVLAYMSIGEAENYRFYWEESWDADNDGQPDAGSPSWLGPSNPDWPGNYQVRCWGPEWQSIIFGSSTSYLDKIIDA